MRATVTRIDRRHDCSACLAYVTVALPELGLEVCGVRVLERPDGTVYANLPHQRDHRGDWFPAVRFMDPTLAGAVRRAAVEAVTQCSN